MTNFNYMMYCNFLVMCMHLPKRTLPKINFFLGPRAQHNCTTLAKQNWWHMRRNKLRNRNFVHKGPEKIKQACGKVVRLPDRSRQGWKGSNGTGGVCTVQPWTVWANNEWNENKTNLSHSARINLYSIFDFFVVIIVPSHMASAIKKKEEVHFLKGTEGVWIWLF